MDSNTGEAVVLPADTIMRIAYDHGRSKGIADCIAIINSVPFTHIDGYPFILHEEALRLLRELQEKP